MRSKRPASNYGLVGLSVARTEPGWPMRFARPVLDRNDASTQWYVGLMYYLGYGVSSDLAAAREWYEKADAQEFPPAKLGLIDLELSAFGSCVAGCSKNSLFSLYRARYDPEQLRYGKKERRAVFREFVTEGEHGDIETRILLGMCYERGIHVEENWDIALEWYRRAAVEGSEEGCALFARLSTAMEGESDAADLLQLARTPPTTPVATYRPCRPGRRENRDMTMRDDAITFARASHLSACSSAQRTCYRATRDFSVLLMFRIC